MLLLLLLLLLLLGSRGDRVDEKWDGSPTGDGKTTRAEDECEEMEEVEEVEGEERGKLLVAASDSLGCSLPFDWEWM